MADVWLPADLQPELQDVCLDFPIESDLPFQGLPSFVFDPPLPPSSPSRDDSSTGQTIFADSPQQPQQRQEEEDEEDDTDERAPARRGVKRERKELELPAEGMCVVLSKEAELEVASLDEYDRYITRLKQCKRLVGSDAQEVTQQRKRIRNRLYALQKRQKEKQSKSKELSTVRALELENEALKREVQRLRRENEALRAGSALSGTLAGVVPRTKRGGVVALALLVTFSVALPQLGIGIGGAGAGEGAHAGTGRALFSIARHSAADWSWWLMALVRVALAVVAMAGVWALYGRAQKRLALLPTLAKKLE